MLISDDRGGEVIEGHPGPVLGEASEGCWIVTVSGDGIWRILSLPRGILTLELRNRLLIGVISWYVYAFFEEWSWLIERERKREREKERERESQVHIPDWTDPQQDGQPRMIHARFLA